MKRILSLLLIAFFTAVGCSPESKTLQTQKQFPEQKIERPQFDPVERQEFKWVTEDGGQSNQEFSPKIDILFVTDNSDSMKSAQENLKRNIDKFTSGLLRNRMIDYHIGVISAWDSSDRAQKTKKDNYSIGDLRFVKNSAEKAYNKRYLDRSVSPELIASTLDIGVTPYNQGGPEIEEFFSPLLSSLEKTGHAAVNEAFFRDDAQLAVIIMTDADDSSKQISPEQMAQKLFDFKNGRSNKISVYGVLVKPSDPDSVKDWDLRIHPKYHPECFDGKKENGKCSGFGPTRLEQFIVAANISSGSPEQIRQKFIMSITSPQFGSDLAKIGSDITVKTLEKDIFIEQRPRYDNSIKKLMLRVRYGTAEELDAGRGQLIPEGTKGWFYRPEDNSIHLSGEINYEYKQGARFAVDLIPLTVKK